MRRTLPVAAASLAAGLALAAPARAQAPRANPGELVRISPATGGHVQGTLIRMDADSVVLRRRAGRDSSVAYPAASLTRVEVARGRSRHPWRGAAIGFVAGGALGELAAVSSTCSSSDCSDIDPLVQAITVTVGAAAGTVVGTVVGLHGRTRWQRVAGPASLTVVPGRGTRVGLSIPTR